MYTLTKKKIIIAVKTLKYNLKLHLYTLLRKLGTGYRHYFSILASGFKYHYLFKSL